MHYVHQEGSQVFKYAVRRMAEMPRVCLEKNGFTKDDLRLLVPHQANLRIIRAQQERLGVDDSKVMVNIDRYGNNHGSDDSPGFARRRRAGPLAQGRPRLDRHRGRRVHHRRRPPPLGVLRTRIQNSLREIEKQKQKRGVTNCDSPLC